MGILSCFTFTMLKPIAVAKHAILILRQLTYAKWAYEPMESKYQSDSASGYIRTGLDIKTLTYICGEKEWHLFK